MKKYWFFIGSSESRSIFENKKTCFFVFRENEVTCKKKYWFLQVFSESPSIFFGKSFAFFHESVISRVSQFRMCTFTQGILSAAKDP